MKKEKENVSLTNEELFDVLNSGSSVQSSILEHNIYLERLNKSKVQLELLSAQYTLKKKEVDELENSVKLKKESTKNLELSHLELKEKIANKYNLQEKWGFAFDGEINPKDVK